MIEVYINDYTNLVMARSKQDLAHISNATMHGMYSMFPSSMINSEDPISEKKMIRKDGQWRVEKDILGWTFDGAYKIMV